MTAAALLILVAALPAAPSPGREPPAVAGVRAATDGPPPAPLADPRGEARPGEVWIDGHWQWTGARWSWVHGQWATPPGPGYAWVPALWTSDDRGFTFHEPFWRPPTRPAAVYEPPAVPHPFARAAPPPLLVELRGPAPGPRAVWIPGFWAWSGERFAWVVGTWSAPVAGATWVEGFWKPERGGFRWVPGRWRQG